MVVIATFFLPLFVALFFGRAFCGGVCALGAIAGDGGAEAGAGAAPARPRARAAQVRLSAAGHRPRHQARDCAATSSSAGSIRSSASSAGRLRPTCSCSAAASCWPGMFVGRPYCRYLCPYGVLLSWCSRLSRRGVRSRRHRNSTADSARACPYGAIETDARGAQGLPLLRALLLVLPERGRTRARQGSRWWSS